MKTKLCGFRCSAEFNALIEQRATELGLSKSAYITQVLRREILSEGGDFRVVREPRGQHMARKSSRKK